MKCKRKIANLIILIIIIILSSFHITFSGSNDGWRQIPDTDEYCYIENNEVQKNKWIITDRKYYYVDNNGILLKDTITPDGYEVNNRGEWVINGKVQKIKISLTDNEKFAIIVAIIIFIPVPLLFGYLILKLIGSNFYKSRKFKFILDANKVNVRDANIIIDKIKNNIKKYSSEEKVCHCSLSVLSNAESDPYKYICKYFNIKINDDTYNYYLRMYNDYNEYVFNYEKLLDIENKIISFKNPKIPLLIRKFDKVNFLLQLGMNWHDNFSFPIIKYVFKYVSPAGRNAYSFTKEFNIETLEDFIKFLNNNVKYLHTKKGQRRLLTTELRNKILARDHYTCKMCGVSMKDEPHISLEIDHIIPIALGGETVESNLQTLCSNCNRKKSANLYN